MKLHTRILLLGLAMLTSVSVLAQSNAPTNLRTTAITYNQVDLTWDDKSTNETKFEVERQTTGGSFSKIGEASANTPSYQDKTATSLNTYSYRVRAVFVTNFSTYSNTLTVSTPQEPPGVPTGLLVTLQGSSIRIAWTNGGGGTADDYQIERGSAQGGPFQLYQTVAYSRTPGYTDNGVSGGQQYCYRVRARNGGGSSGFTGALCATVPLAPTQIVTLKATTLNSSSIKLTWNPYGKESPITIERRKGQTGNFDKIKDWLADSGEFTDTGLEANTEYCYRIGESGHDYSTVVCATTQQSIPATPARLTASAVSSTRIDLQWADLSTNESRFEIERADGPTAPFNKIQDVNANTTSYTDNSVQGSKTYCYRVRAVNAVGASGYTDPPACATTPVPPVGVPQNLIATATSTTQINLTWSAVPGASGYQLERSPNGNDSWQNIGPSPATATNFVDNGRVPNTRYYYRVRALNASGVPGDYSNVTNAITPDVPPKEPAQLTITSFTYNQISLQWADQSTNETGFQIERSTDGTKWDKIADAGTNATSYTDQNVAPQTHYYYRVRAVNAAGSSTYTNPVDATTPVGPPTAAQDLKATALSTTQISLTWSAIPNAATIVIERSADGVSGWSSLTSVSGTTTSYTDNGLTPNQHYYYRIRATNVSGTGGNSNVADATTPDVPPKEPANLKATLISSNQINLQWTDQSTNESGFEIEQGSSATGTFNKIASLPANTITYEVKNLTDATPYCFRVRAVNAAGPSVYTDPACATTPLAPPATPTNLTARVSDYDQILLNWDAVSPKAITISIERSTNPNGPFQEIRQVPASQTTYVDAGLQEYTTYYYRIRSINTAGNSNYSNVATARVEEVVIAVEDEWIIQTQAFIDNHTLHIRTDWYRTAQAQVQLHTLTGRVQLTDNRRVGPADAWSYSLAHIPSGIYVVAITAEGQTFTKRILLP